MREKRWFLPFLVALVACVMLPAAAAEAEEVKAYMGFARPVNEAIVAHIKKELGIEIKGITLSWGEIWARLLAEKPNFGADMVIDVGVFQAITGKKEGMYERYPAPPAWRDMEPRYKDPEGYYYDVGTFSFVLIGNKKRLAEKGYSLPTSWKELLDPRWKGEIITPSPVTSGTAFMINYSFLSLYGEAEGWKFLEALDRNVIRYTKGGNEPTEVVGRGEATLGITSDEAVPIRIKEGYPIVWGIPKEGIGYEGNYNMILKGTKNLEAAKKIVNHFGTAKFQEFFSQFGYIPARPGYRSGLYGDLRPTFIKIDHAWAVANRERILEAWKEKFLRR